VSETYRYALVVLLASASGLAAVLSNRLTDRLRIPAPLFMLAAAAVAAAAVPGLRTPTEQNVEHAVTLALVLILFDGGMQIGWRRFRDAAAPIVVVGVLGTFLTAGAGALLLHEVFGLDWYLALLVSTAVAPTDPAVVFSVLGKKVIPGRSGTILEGESGANDPVGIALMSALIAAGGLSTGAFGEVAVEFVLQMVIGCAVGAVGGWALLWFMRQVPLPSEGLYPLRSAACAFMVFGAGTLLHGSGFLAVFVAGILIGDARAPYKSEIRRFHSALASLGEIVAFIVLGLTVDLDVLVRADVWGPGLVLGLALAVVIRPVCAGICLLPARLKPNELAFVLFAGLKGAVPILLGEMVLATHLPEAERLFGIVVVVVVFSVLCQGSLVPYATRLLRLRTLTVEPEPFSLGVQLRDEPGGVHRLRVEPGSAADGRTVDEVADGVGEVWISIVVRDSALLPIRGTTRLQAGDDVVVLADADVHDSLTTAFSATAPDD
jgi:cell volume regulation protein A